MMLASPERKREIEFFAALVHRTVYCGVVGYSRYGGHAGDSTRACGTYWGDTRCEQSARQRVGIMLSLQVLYSSSFIALALIYLTTLILSLVPAWRLRSGALLQFRRGDQLMKPKPYSIKLHCTVKAVAVN